MNETPKGNRLHIAIMGRTNTGKSSLLNMISGQDVAITSPVAGTTTDVVEKAMELLPLGPVLFLDTAGVDDSSSLSGLRLGKTVKALDRADVVVLVTEPGVWTDYEDEVIAEAGKRKAPVLIAVNKVDLAKPSPEFVSKVEAKSKSVIFVSSLDGGPDREKSIAALKRLLIEITPEDFLRTPSLVGDLLPPGGLAVLVVPIDLQAPKGRLILPQVQTIRDALDNDAAALIVKERELASTLKKMNIRPDLVVCDSQAVLKVSADIAPEIPFTTFSILFARQKGDIIAAAEGAARIEDLEPGDRVLIAEACTHHALEDDIGRVKIPRWLRQYVGGELDVSVSSGRDYPDDLGKYRLIIHCGACMLNRREMLNRVQRAREARVPITNYGVAISYLQGVAKRTLSPFPAALLALERKLDSDRAGRKQ
jgi:[FeFe] hydrogenase H-cluster maturation GTPase HydF